jgi:hypothetical protein
MLTLNWRRVVLFVAGITLLAAIALVAVGQIGRAHV